ncbi:MAG: membrane protein insertion efficiency factor YidD [Clostridia bacterium]|nr:membrane protein insertion efficiency factor YidD [Clostridia bacterium]
MKYICIWLIRFYRKFLSPLKGGACCRFTPSCSAYAIEAFQKRGFFVGMILTVWRILRCNPYCAGGYDPVPEHGLRYKGSRIIPTPDACCEDGGECSGERDGKIASDCEVHEEDQTDTSIHGKEKNL